jgi:hypothetical protein
VRLAITAAEDHHKTISDLGLASIMGTEVGIVNLKEISVSV